MILEENETGREFTEDSLLEYLKEKYKTKKNGKEFAKIDIVQYVLRGNIPRAYGGNKITVHEQFGVKLLFIENKV